MRGRKPDKPSKKQTSAGTPLDEKRRRLEEEQVRVRREVANKERLIKEAPKNTWSHYYAASLFFIQGRLDMALQAARNAVAIDPSNAKAHNLIGASLASMGQTDAARTAFETSIKEDPREAGTYANLATLELQSANRDRAKRYFAEALTIDPNNQAARDGLATLISNSTR